MHIWGGLRTPVGHCCNPLESPQHPTPSNERLHLSVVGYENETAQRDPHRPLCCSSASSGVSDYSASWRRRRYTGRSGKAVRNYQTDHMVAGHSDSEPSCNPHETGPEGNLNRGEREA